MNCAPGNNVFLFVVGVSLVVLLRRNFVADDELLIQRPVVEVSGQVCAADSGGIVLSVQQADCFADERLSKTLPR
jgi:hypothetical protein